MAETDAQQPRPVPYSLQIPLGLWLDQCVEHGILESVPTDEQITWRSPVVVQPKPKFFHVPIYDLQPYMIWACIDLRVPNKHIEINRIAHISPTNASVHGIFKAGPQKWLPPADVASRFLSRCNMQHPMGEITDKNDLYLGQNHLTMFFMARAMIGLA